MALYRIIPDGDVYYEIRTLEENPKGRIEILYNGRLKDTWKPPKVGIVKDGKPADLMSWVGYIVCSEEVLHILKPFTGDTVEYLPLDHSKNKYYTLNVIEQVPMDLVNSEVAKSPSGRIAMVNKFAFKESDIKGKKIFLPEQTPFEGPIVSEEFKEFIEKNNLEGLKFKPI